MVTAQLSYAQLFHYSNLPEQNDTLKLSILPNQTIHSAIKPFYVEDLKFMLNNNNSSVSDPIADTSTEKNKDYISVSGLADATGGFAHSPSRSGYAGDYTIGLVSEVKISGKRPEFRNNSFAFYLNYNFNRTLFPDYVQARIARNQVVPGLGYARSVDWGYRYQNLSFYAAKNVGKYFVFEAGMGKHFYGEGHRSLFLSDAAYSYPYFKITTSVWKLKYVNMWTNFKDISDGYDNWFHAKNKYGAFHYLSWNATKRLNINLFEAVIWSGRTAIHTRNFDVNYLNPIIFYRPVEFSLGSPDNAILGIGGNYRVGKKHLIYSQILLDDFLLSEVRAGFTHLLHPSDSSIKYGSWFNKQAWQLGYKYFDIAGVNNLDLQTELNYVRPYTYSHRIPIQNYGHFNEPLAHPLGANFWESVSFLRYTKNKWYFEAEYLHYLTGLDSNGTHFGEDIYKATYDTYEATTGNIVVKQYGNKVGQGIKTTVNFISLKTSYLFYSPLNLRIEAGFIFRKQNSFIENKTTNYIFLGIKTSLDRKCFDF